LANGQIGCNQSSYFLVSLHDVVDVAVDDDNDGGSDDDDDDGHWSHKSFVSHLKLSTSEQFQSKSVLDGLESG